jgi:RNA-splicing ligase RtcB
MIYKSIGHARSDMLILKGKYTTAKIMIDSVDESCLNQINDFINHSAFTNPVAIMPDTHAGKGSVIGFTMPLSNKVIPNVIGVDIGCGMHSINIGNNLNLSLEKLDYKIRRSIPFGNEVHDNAIINFKNDFPWHKVNVMAEKFTAAYKSKFKDTIESPRYTNEWFMEKSQKIGGNIRRYINSIGTLGGGNHFIETGISDKGDYWITVHSGSRNFGKRICEYWQNRAIKILKKENIPGISTHTRGLEWLEGEMAAQYLFDMVFSQIYAGVNRKYIINSICSILKLDPLESIETVHNFIDFKDLIIRKGAIRSYEGERIIIPFNMRDGLIICEGKSNPDWNFSAPHGAGRVMSRNEAKKNLDIESFKQQMKGIYSTSVGSSTLDESPDSYKEASLIKKAIKDTAEIMYHIKPLHNMKDTAQNRFKIKKNKKKGKNKHIFRNYS